MHGAEDFDPVFQQAANDLADALLVLSDSFLQSHIRRIVEFADRSHLPLMSAEPEWGRAGGLMAYGPDVAAMHYRAAYYVDRILKGAKPADLPVERPMRFDFAVNMKTARALGITFPPDILLQVTEVIDG